MKNSTFIGIVLTLVMLLMVAIAAFIFLFPRQQAILQENDALTADSDQLRQDLAQTSLELVAVEETRAAVAEALATSEANGVILAGELVESDQAAADLQAKRDDLTTQLAEATAALAELQIENQQMKAQFPFVTLVSPEDGAIIPLGEPVDIVVVAYDPAGVTAVNLTLDDDTQSFEGDDEHAFIRRQTWRPGGQGTHTISLMAINIGGKASVPISVTVQLIDIDVFNASIRSEIEASVIELTGLTPLEPIEPTLLTREELGARIEADLAEEATLEEMRQDVLVLSAFDFVEQDYDLYTALVALYTEGVLGFYDAETAEFVVVSDDDALDAGERLTHAHEFVHALQDQYYELELINDESLDSEAAAALRALAEGHATLVEGLYLTSGALSQEEVAQIINGAEEESGALDDFPPFLVNDLSFPYTAGFEFVFSLYQRDGFEAIAGAWNDLPQSTEQILHVDRYLVGDAPQIVALPPLMDTLGAGWQLLEEDTLGEFYLREYLSQQLDDASVEMAAGGWGGDRYAVYFNEADDVLVMALRLAWDTLEDGIEFMAIYPQYPAYLFATSDELLLDGLTCWTGTADFICLTPLEDDALVVRAPDVETAVAVTQSIINN